MPKTATALHLLPTDDLRTRLDREVGGVSIDLKNRGLDWLFRDLDGKTVVAHYFPAQSLLNIHAGGVARPTFQANGIGPDDIPSLLAKHLDREDEEPPGNGAAAPKLRGDVPIESDLSGRQRQLLFDVVVRLAGNPGHAGLSPGELVRRARDIVLEATNVQAQDSDVD